MSDPTPPTPSTRKRVRAITPNTEMDAYAIRESGSTSVENVHIPPRTPKSPRASYGGPREDSGEEEVQMRLLVGNGSTEEESNVAGLHEKNRANRPFSAKDKHAIALLVVLYLIQGVPIGLAMGSMPFLLKTSLSYSQLGVFTLSSYPYSLKLLWSPIVDSIFSPKLGRRKSWIVPIQLIIGSMMLWLSMRSDYIFDHPENKVTELTLLFVSLVFMSATQDIAVDGWALTLLSEDNLSYASTCQTIGLNTGFFSSFTMFLAFSSPEFANMLGIPPLTLSVYLKFWSLVCYSVTVWLLFFKTEDPVASDDPDLGVMKVYRIIWSIVKLKHVMSLCGMYLVAKIGFIANDSVSSLKLIEKGLKTEQYSTIVTTDFFVQLFAGYYAARWGIGDKPLRPWLYAFWLRLFFSLSTMAIVYVFPVPPPSFAFVCLVGLNYIGTQFAATIQFVGISAFHTRISDPLIGGTYMTLLNTASNLGGTWPKIFVMKGVDYFTQATCRIKDELLVEANECVTEPGREACEALGGVCITERDGYYVVTILTTLLAALILVFYVRGTANRLQALPTSKWRVHLNQ
ncbi:MFS general substrate transporter [Sistotremastrum niveocremeum HHB9708]|uniref:MFS general substrate transporter n=2 Tax=Sistotremastraceae TaxID=3402574 RepID=A0A164R736_9AGAM|nr:MFS general substrate transporter [Sistotremastrum niveocremeum HHB9708]KZT42801.1 hypothetical protein SISSUDRAFT_1041050 [Sistotremastrum suecicum HHB10207 ss-3]